MQLQVFMKYYVNLVVYYFIAIQVLVLKMLLLENLCSTNIEVNIIKTQYKQNFDE